MARYIFRSLMTFVPMLLVVAVIAALLIRLVPGNPVMLMLGYEASGDAIQQMEIKLGLHLPILQRLPNWFVRAFHGDLGDSFFLKAPVTALIAERFPVTLGLVPRNHYSFG